jgi:hypothetical protein
MTVGELKRRLLDFDDEAEVIISATLPLSQIAAIQRAPFVARNQWVTTSLQEVMMDGGCLVLSDQAADLEAPDCDGDPFKE